jgi:hypothetical protein
VLNGSLFNHHLHQRLSETRVLFCKSGSSLSLGVRHAACKVQAPRVDLMKRQLQKQRIYPGDSVTPGAKPTREEVSSSRKCCLLRLNEGSGEGQSKVDVCILLFVSLSVWGLFTPEISVPWASLIHREKNAWKLECCQPVLKQINRVLNTMVNTIHHAASHNLSISLRVCTYRRYVQTRVLPRYARPLEEPRTTGAGLTGVGDPLQYAKAREGVLTTRKHSKCKKHHCEFSYRKSYRECVAFY